MTREEAAIIIKECKDKGFKHTFYTLNEYHTALDMAIKALEQEPCEDVVSRKDLLKIYEDRFLKLQKIKRLKDNKGAEDRQMGVNYCINILKEMSSVTPQPKIGRWIDDKCSVCGKGIEDLIDSREWYENEEPNFCPFCGCRLVEPQERSCEE